MDWLKLNLADIVTMHLGTNDIFLTNHKTPEIITALGKLADQMRVSNPAMRIIVRLKAIPKHIKLLNMLLTKARSPKSFLSLRLAVFSKDRCSSLIASLLRLPHL